MQVAACYYCSIKQKFSINTQSQKCMMHSINDPQTSDNSSNQQFAPIILQETIDLLHQVNKNLQQYWNNLHHYSLGNSEKVSQELSTVVHELRLIEQKLSRFPLDSMYFSLQKSRPIKDKWEYEDKKMSTRSQKFKTSNFSQFFDECTVNDQIKQWVTHFHKILINREICDQVLSFEEHLDLKIFKDSMERKFITFAKNYDTYQKKIGNALQKLLFYMQNCSNGVSPAVLKQDLIFIEQCQAIASGFYRQQDNQWLLMQALSIEQLLAQKQFY